MTSHHDMQKIRIIGIFFENRLHWQFVLGYMFIYVHIKQSHYTPEQAKRVPGS